MGATQVSPSALCIVVLLLSGGQAVAANAYYGRLIGSLESPIHELRGDVYAVDARTLFIKGFSYNGYEDQDTVFFGGSSPKSGTDGFVIPNENGSTERLAKSYDNQDLTLTLPEGKTLKELKWVTLLNREEFDVLGEVRIPTGFDYPRPQRLNALSGIHKVNSDRIYVVDAQTFLIPNFTYDGAAPDAFFWVGHGNKPTPNGIQVPDENGKIEPLRRYDAKTLVLTLPGELTVFDIDWISVWCRAFTIDFGHIRIPKTLNVPPSLKMLGVAPQAKLNCEVLWDDLALEVRWAVAGETIVLQLVGKIDDGQYVAFGPSGDPRRTRMIGSDMAVGWLDRLSGKGFVDDYHATSKSQCNAGRGVCRDVNQAKGNNNIRLLNAALVNEYVMLTYQRPLKAQDDYDRPIITNGSQAVIWAVGPLSSAGEPSYHKLRNKGDLIIDFGRSPFWNCPAPEDQNAGLTTAQPFTEQPQTPHPYTEPPRTTLTERVETNLDIRPTTAPEFIRPLKPIPKPWYVPPIQCFEPENHVFYAHIGPSGGVQGYNGITGNVGWNIAWYINGLLVPEVTVIRGETYTFVVEGGRDPDRPARHHPFYITDDPEGGYEFKTPTERSRSRVFAGVRFDRDGHPAPSAMGRLCEWVEDPAHPADAFSSFGAYQRTLKLHCEEGQPAIVQWTPDQSTPDTVYYQCYTHRFLGWKIRVVDGCDRANQRAEIDLTDGPVKPELTLNREFSETDSREGIDYSNEYYDEEPMGPDQIAGLPSDVRVNVARPSSGRPPLTQPASRQPSKSADDGFFGNSAFPKFPVFPDGDMDTFFDAPSPFGSKKVTSPTRPPPPTRSPSTETPTPRSAPPTKTPPSRTPPPVRTTQSTRPSPTKLPTTQAIPTKSRAGGAVQPFSFPNNAVRQPFVLPAQPQDNFDINVRTDMKVGQQPHQSAGEHAVPTKSNRPFGFLSKGTVKGVPLPQSERSDLNGESPSAILNNRYRQPEPNRNQQPVAVREPSLRLTPPGRWSSGATQIQYKSSFDPTTVVLESGFKPIRKSGGPTPPLGFEVDGDDSDDEEEGKESAESKQGSVFTPSEGAPPPLVTLEPVFIPSDPDHLLSKNRNAGPTPIQLPEAVVPVVPGRAPPPQQRRPTHPPSLQQHHPQQQHTHQHLGSVNQPPSFQRQPQPGTKPPRKTGGGLSALFGFNRRQQQKPVLRIQHPQSPQVRRPPQGHPAHPVNQREQPYDGQQLHQSPHDGPLRSEEGQYHSNQPTAHQAIHPNPRPNPPAGPKLKPQRLSGLKLLRRFLVGDRRQDQQPNTVVKNNPKPAQKRPKPAKPMNKAVPKLEQRPGQPKMTFQGPLPPVVEKRPGWRQKPQRKTGDKSSKKTPNRRNDKKKQVLDPFSASIISGRPILGVPVSSAVRVPALHAQDRMQLESMIFATPGKPGYEPRALGSSSVDVLGEDDVQLDELDNFADDSDDYQSTDVPDTTEEYPVDDEHYVLDDVTYDNQLEYSEDDYDSYHHQTDDPNMNYTDDHTESYYESDDSEDHHEIGDSQNHHKTGTAEDHHEMANDGDHHADVKEDHHETDFNVENHAEHHNEELYQDDDGSHDSDTSYSQVPHKHQNETQDSHQSDSDDHRDKLSHEETGEEGTHHLEAIDSEKPQAQLTLTDIQKAHLMSNTGNESSSVLGILKDIISKMNKEAGRGGRDMVDRAKRSPDVDQHLDQPDNVDSSFLPVEHRGLDDDEPLLEHSSPEHKNAPTAAAEGLTSSMLTLGLTLTVLLLSRTRC